MTPAPYTIPAGPGTFLFSRDQLRVSNKCAADAAYAKMLADNPGFAAVIPQLEELAGFHAIAEEMAS